MCSGPRANQLPPASLIAFNKPRLLAVRFLPASRGIAISPSAALRAAMRPPSAFSVTGSRFVLKVLKAIFAVRFLRSPPLHIMHVEPFTNREQGTGLAEHVARSTGCV